MTSPKETLSTENVVASTKINQEVDLKSLSLDLNGVSYDPDNFPGLVYRMQDPKATSLIFRSGKIVCTGAQSIAEVEKAVQRTFEAFRELELDVPDDPELSVQNTVTSGDLDARLNLNAIAIGVGLENVEYEPEQFPGLVYRLEDPEVVMLLFGSGKVVITGGTKPKDAEVAIEVIQTRLTDLGLLNE